MMKVLKKKVFKCLLVRKVVGMGLLRPATINQVHPMVVKVVDIGLLSPATIPQVIVEVVDVGLFLPATLPFVIGRMFW